MKRPNWKRYVVRRVPTARVGLDPETRAYRVFRYLGPGGGYQPAIAWGSTKREAWANAARFIRSRRFV